MRIDQSRQMPALILLEVPAMLFQVLQASNHPYRAILEGQMPRVGSHIMSFEVLLLLFEVLRPA